MRSPAYDPLPVLADAERIVFSFPDVSLSSYRWTPSTARSVGPTTAVILLHGWGEDASDLADIGPKIARAGNLAFSVSLRGWRGSSGIADYGRSDPHDVHRVVASIREQFAPDRMVLIGFSMGGLIALLSAAAVPSSTSVIDGVVAISSPVELRSFYADTAFAGVRRYLDSTLTNEQWDGCSPLQQAAKITCPTLIVVGSLDTMCPPDQGRRLARALPQAELLEIADMAHHPNTTQWNTILQQARANLL